MFFSCIAKSVSIMVLSINTIVMGLSKGVEIGYPYIFQNIENIEIVEKENYEWKIEIPKIELIANISNGTDEGTMNEYVGHFEETELVKGNVGLAAHNRGYKVNYFKNLKKLEIGDRVYYTYLGYKREYIIDKITVIKDTNWEPLKNTKENRLTLITCIENEPEYRLCVQAIEINTEN